MTTFLLRCMSLEATPCRPLLRVERGSAVGHEETVPELMPTVCSGSEAVLLSELNGSMMLATGR